MTTAADVAAFLRPSAGAEYPSLQAFIDACTYEATHDGVCCVCQEAP